jgi:hypothetical protein
MQHGHGSLEALPRFRVAGDRKHNATQPLRAVMRVLLRACGDGGGAEDDWSNDKTKNRRLAHSYLTKNAVAQ